MKVLHIITGLHNGGAEAALFRLVTGDSRNSHTVIALMDEDVYGARLRAAGIPVWALGMPRGRVTAAGIRQLYRTVRSIAPDVVQTWMYHADLIGGIVARLTGARRVVWGIRGPFNRERTPWSTAIAIRLCAMLSRWLPAAIVSNSEHAAAVHVKAGYDVRKLVCIPNGYPLGLFRPDAAAGPALREELAVAQDAILIGMVARFDPYKDHGTLLAAVAAVARQAPKVVCLLAGPGMLASNEEVAALVARQGAGGCVRLLGPRTDVPKIMAALDLHVLSSAAESFPNVLAEAMACATPCVSTDVGDAAAMVGETGWLVPSGDAGALARAVLAALDEMKDAERWNHRREACRGRIAEHYSLERMIVSYTRVWGELIHGK